MKILPVIFGIKGTKISAEEEFFFNSCKPYGLILFARNIESEEQLKRLVVDLKSLVGHDVKLFIDQEGGSVQRIKPPIGGSIYPPASLFVEMLKNSSVDKVAKAVEENFYNLMTELKSFGIDHTCAPVADLLFENMDKIVGDRSFGASVEQVVLLCNAALDGIHKAGGEGVIKHIPGHGRAKCDSHHELPIVEEELSLLKESDFAVFAKLKDKCKYAMTAHILYTHLDDEFPATLSLKVIDYIRRDIGFKGMIMTDDICMKALKGDAGQIAIKSIEAGCDLILHCSGEMAQMQEVKDALLTKF